MKLNDFATGVRVYIQTHPDAEIADVLLAMPQRSACEIAFVLYQLRMFGYL